MEEDVIGAQHREKAFKNKAKRREKWLQRKGWTSSRNNNPRIRVEGYYVTIFQRGGWCWSIVRGTFKEFSSRAFATPDEAALATFDRFEVITGRDQP